MDLISAVFDGLCALGGILVSFVGGCDALLEALCVLMVLDVVTGASVAYYLKRSKHNGGEFSWNELRKGLTQKLLILVIVSVASMVDVALGMELIRPIACLYYIAEEGLSVIGVLETAGVPIPRKAVQLLRVIESKNGTEDEVDDTSDK